jgi:hypothetical protein
MAYQGILSTFLNKTTGSAISAKGGLTTVLFSWIPTAFESVSEWSLYVVLILGLILFSYIMYRKKMYHSIVREHLLMLVFSLAVFTGIFFCYYYKHASNSFASVTINGHLPFIVFFVILFLFLYELLVIIKNRLLTEQELQFHLPFFAALGIAIAINYGSGTSSSLCQGQTALNVGLIIGILLYLSKHKYAEPIRVVILGSCLCICLCIASYKYMYPYQWWGLAENDLREATQELDVPNAHNIKVSESTRQGIEGIYQDIITHSDESDSIFVFPHASIFYTLADRESDTYTYIQWYDVSTDAAVIADIETLKENLPAVIVHVHIPETTTTAHETMFRNNEHSGLYQMDLALSELEANENYVLANSYILQGLSVDVYYLEN